MHSALRSVSLDITPGWLSLVQRWPTNASREWAERTFPKLCANPSVVAVVLLGSTIRPVDSSYDLDCLYIYQGTRPRISRPPGDVDIRAVDSLQVDQLIASGHDLLVWSLKLGQLVCERDCYWTYLQARWRARLPFPSAQIADDRAAKAEKLLADLRSIGDEDAVVEQLVTALTHRARAALLREHVFPASRPELPGQLRKIGQTQLAESLSSAIRTRNAYAHEYAVGASEKR